MELKLARGEVLLRVLAVMVLVATACLVAFDTQTKVIFLTITKKATYKDMDALKGLVYVTSAAAGYNLVQLGKLSVSAYSGADGKGSYDTNNNIYMAWITFLLDQVLLYMTVVANTGALEASLVAKNGVEEFQWVKVCNRFGRFCVQIGGALLCGYAASIIMALISTVSAYHVFRMYSPKRFLRFKPRSSIAPSSSSSYSIPIGWMEGCK